MDAIVGIIVVTNSSRGHHFVYKYPPESQRDALLGDLYRVKQAVKGNVDLNAEDFHMASKVLGYDPQFLANFLSPKLALCDKRFQLTVDDLTFVGHPVSLSRQEFRQRREYFKWKAARPRKMGVKRGWVTSESASFLEDSDTESDSCMEDSQDEADLERSILTGSSVKEIKETESRLGSRAQHEGLLTSRSLTDPSGWRQQRFRSQTCNSTPVSPACGDSPVSSDTLQTTSALHQGFGSSLASHPLSMPQTPTTGIQGAFSPPHLGIAPSIHINQNEAANRVTVSTSSPSVHVQQMSYFHIVFVLKPAELQRNTVADQVYVNIACKLTAALRYEELNNQYVSQEATKILSIREEATQTGLTLGQFHEQVQAASSLARSIKAIYECVIADRICHVVLNDSIDLSLQIPHLAPLPRANTYLSRVVQNCLPSDSPTGQTSNGLITGSQQVLMTPMATQYGGVGGLGYMMDDYEIGMAYEYENFPLLLPYHTLLLLEDPEEILKDIPLDASPTLVKLVQILVPYQCLEELQYILDCSMAQIYRLASHLIYWRKAKLIDQIRVSNVYVVAPQAGINKGLVTDFSSHFPTLSLPNVLHELSTPKAYKAHIPGAGKDKEVQTVYLEMLTYLLRKELVVQLHTYILIVVPEYIKIGCSAEEYEHMTNEESSGMLTPTMESPISHQGVTSGGQGSSVKSADFVHSSVMPPQAHHQHSQRQQLLQQTMPSQTYRYHNRSSTGPGAQGSATAGTSGMSTSLRSQMSMTMKPFGKRQDASSILPNPGQASDAERQWIQRMCENQPQSVAALFMRLSPYFNGQHHVEEILFREQIVGKDLKTVLTAFQEYLILTWAYRA